MRSRLLPSRLLEAERYLKGRFERSLQLAKNDADRARCWRLTNLYTAIAARGDGLARAARSTYKD